MSPRHQGGWSAGRRDAERQVSRRAVLGLLRPPPAADPSQPGRGAEPRWVRCGPDGATLPALHREGRPADRAPLDGQRLPTAQAGLAGAGSPDDGGRGAKELRTERPRPADRRNSGRLRRLAREEVELVVPERLTRCAGEREAGPPLRYETDLAR